MGLLDDKVAIITGGAHGIGRGHALEIAKEGAKLVINDLGSDASGEGKGSDADDVVRLVKERYGTEAIANYGDVSDFESAKQMVDQAIETFGTLDILVNNAGIVRDKAIWNMTEQDWDSVMRVHTKGTFCPTHHAAVYWRAKNKETGKKVNGRVINTVSGAGLEGNFGQANYTAAKGAIASFTLTTSLELFKMGVTVNCISPGGHTRLSATMGHIDSVKEPEEWEEWDFFDPSNCSPVVAWLASDEAQHVTGQILRAVGNSIIRYRPWEHGEKVENDGRRWEPDELTALMNAHVFHSRPPGLGGLPPRKKKKDA